MTQKIAIFSEDGNHVISMLDYDTEFVSNLTSSTVKHKVLDINPDTEYYWGTYETGAVRSLDEQPIVEEVVLETITNKEILAKYPVHAQLNIMAECIEKSGIPLTSEFIEMRTWIKNKVNNHNSAINAYESNPSLYSWWPKPVAPTE